MAAAGSLLPIVASGGLAAGGLAGSLLTSGGGNDGTDLQDLPIGGLIPGADPLLALLQQNVTAQLGGDPAQVAGRGSPLLQFLEFPRTQGPFTPEFAQSVFSVPAKIASSRVAEGIAEGLSDQEIVQGILNEPGVVAASGWPDIAANGSGFSSFEDMILRQIDFQRALPERERRLTEDAEQARLGISAAIKGTSELLQDLPIPTQANIDALAASFSGDITRERRNQANVGGFPVDLRNVGREGQQQALELLTGQTTVAGNALNILLGSQTAATELGLDTVTTGQAGLLGTSQLTGAQANALTTGAPDNNTSDLLGLIGGVGLDQLLSRIPGGSGGGGSLPGSVGGGAPGTGGGGTFP